MVKYSVIIPAYNCAETIEKTINSILLSNLDSFEIVIIDDGSNDNTASVCKSISNIHSEVSYFYKENSGVSDTRNYGMTKAHGEYILFVDADDILLPFENDLFGRVIMDHPDMILFGMCFRYLWKGKKVKEETLSATVSGTFQLHELPQFFNTLFDSNYLSAVWNKFFRRDLLMNHSIVFNKKLNNYEDLDFTLRVLTECNKITVLETPYYIYQNEYGTDRTPLRIAKIDDIMANTDIIADSFFKLDEKIYLLTAKHLPDIYTIVIQIYMEIFRHKMQTTKIDKISQYCQSFEDDFYIKKCIDNYPDITRNRSYQRIVRKNSLEIYMYYAYLRIRHKFADRVKLLKCMR